MNISSGGNYELTPFAVKITILGNEYDYTYGNHQSIRFPGGDIPMTINFTVPTITGCGAIGNFSITIDQATGSGQVMCINPYFSGNTDICGFNTNSTYTLTTVGNLPNNGTRTWNINQSGWLINGQTPPVNITAFSATITTPNNASNATLSISGDYLCSTLNISIHCNSTAPSTPTILNKYRLGNSCYYYLTTNSFSNATTYEWSCVSSFQYPEITTTNSTTGVGVNCPDLEQNTYVPIYVRARNGCNPSNYLYKYTFFPAISNCQYGPIHDSTFNSSLITTPSIDNSSLIIKTISGGTFELDINFNFSEVKIEVYSSNGKLLQTLNPFSNTVSINLTNNPDGIYFIKLISDDCCITKKLVKW
jgi:hypothetical protein